MQIHHIKLSALTLSDLNVRKTERDADIASLAADIEARGLKQNLVVVATEADEDIYEVVAGGRRYQAMMMLLEEGKYTGDMTVPCLLEGRDGAVETSLSENLHRVAMNPADEFTAFKTIIDQADGDEAARVAYCAKRFGVTEKHVIGRLRLASLAEPILDALRANIITLGAAMAYASFSDTEKQVAVFEQQQKSKWKPHDPDQIRAAMKDKTYGVTDGKVLFVGLDKYKAAGGATDIDLFTIDAEERLLDTKLVDKMAVDTFAKRKGALAKRMGFEDIVLQKGYNAPNVDGYKDMYVYSPEKRKEVIDNAVAAGLKIIGCYEISSKGKMEPTQHLLIELTAEEKERAAAKARGEEQSSTNHHVMTEEERAELNRQRGIRLEAFRLAVPVTKDTAFANRLYLPNALQWYRMNERTREVDGVIEKGFTLEIDFFVTAEELESHLDEAAKVVELALQEQAEAKRMVEQAKQERAAALQAIVSDLESLEQAPAVIKLDGHIEYMFLWSTGEYWAAPQEDGDDEPDEMPGYESLSDLIEGETPEAFWLTMEEFETAMAAEAQFDPESEQVGDQADAEIEQD